MTIQQSKILFVQLTFTGDHPQEMSTILTAPQADRIVAVFSTLSVEKQCETALEAAIANFERLRDRILITCSAGCVVPHLRKTEKIDGMDRLNRIVYLERNLWAKKIEGEAEWQHQHAERSVYCASRGLEEAKNSLYALERGMDERAVYYVGRALFFLARSVEASSGSAWRENVEKFVQSLCDPAISRN